MTNINPEKNYSETELFLAALSHGIQEMIEIRYEQLKKEFLERIERDKAVELSAISLRIMKSIDIQNKAENLVITLRTEKQ